MIQNHGVPTTMCDNPHFISLTTAAQMSAGIRQVKAGRLPYIKQNIKSVMATVK